MMETDARRRFTIADGMILIAAMALSLIKVGSPRSAFVPYLEFALAKLSWAGLVFSVALILIRIRSPRPCRDDLWRQPGWIACIAIMISLTTMLLQFALEDATTAKRAYVGYTGWGANIDESIEIFRCFALVALGVSWTILGASGRWKAEPSWVDRAGRLIGVFWIVLSVLGAISGLFH